MNSNTSSIQMQDPIPQIEESGNDKIKTSTFTTKPIFIHHHISSDSQNSTWNYANGYFSLIFNLAKDNSPNMASLITDLPFKHVQ